MLPSNCPPWKNPRIVLLLCLVFLSGAVAGALAMKLWRPAKVLTAGPDVFPEGNRRVLERFRTQLDLTPEQTRAFEEILDDYGKYYHSLQAQMSEMWSNGKSRMLALLTDEQRKKFVNMGAEFEKKPFKIR